MSNISKYVPECRTIVLGSEEFTTGPFEGVEKRMIIQFNKEKLLSIFHDRRMLRSISAKNWQTVLDGAACRILSQIDSPDGFSNDDEEGCTAYLLSESSLFVYESRIILKTCGTTTPLLSLPILLKILYNNSDVHNSDDLSTAPSYNSSQSSSDHQTSHHEGGHVFSKSQMVPLSSSSSSEVRSSSDVESEPSFIIDSGLLLQSQNQEHYEVDDDDALKENHGGTHHEEEDHLAVDVRSPPSLIWSPDGGGGEEDDDDDGDDECDWHVEDSDSSSSDEETVGGTVASVSEDLLSMSSSSSSPRNHWCGGRGQPVITEEKLSAAAGAGGMMMLPPHWNCDGDNVVDWMLFTHLNYSFPEKQKFPHRSFDEEVEFIHTSFNSSRSSKLHSMGYGNKYNDEEEDVDDDDNDDVGSQCITYFTLPTSPGREFSVCGYHSPLMSQQQQQQHASLSSSSSWLMIEEMMMIGIDEGCVRLFAGDGDGSVRSSSIITNDDDADKMTTTTTTTTTVTDDVMVVHHCDHDDEKVLDEFWFDPCGYSCNALSKGMKESGYMTTHISPEAESSYASFEWSHFTIPLEDLLMQKCIDTFQPQKVHVVSVGIGFDGTVAAADMKCPEVHVSRSNKFECVARCSRSSSSASGSSSGWWFHVTHSEHIRL